MLYIGIIWAPSFVRGLLGLLTYFPQQCGRWWSACYWLFSAECPVVFTVAGILGEN